METFFLFLLVGVLAQAVDGALGMAYGVISSSVLLALGVPPATASASVHAAEVFTTAASAGSHAANRNVNWKLFAPLALGGVVGGGLGAFAGKVWRIGLMGESSRAENVERLLAALKKIIA